MERIPKFAQAFQSITYIRTDKSKTSDDKILLLAVEAADHDCTYRVEIILKKMSEPKYLS